MAARRTSGIRSAGRVSVLAPKGSTSQWTSWARRSTPRRFRSIRHGPATRRLRRPSPAPAPAPPPRDTAVRRPPAGYTVSFAALLVADKARELAASIRVGSENARVVTAVRDGSTIYRVVLGPYSTREEAERVGRESRQSYWIYEGGP